jgi:hypothetical protein
MSQADDDYTGAFQSLAHDNFTIPKITTIWRLNGEIRDREKTMRGVKKMDSVVLNGYQLYHNYFREHEGLNGKTPAEIAGIKIQGENKWMTVIQNAKRDG